MCKWLQDAKVVDSSTHRQRGVVTGKSLLLQYITSHPRSGKKLCKLNGPHKRRSHRSRRGPYWEERLQESKGEEWERRAGDEKLVKFNPQTRISKKTIDLGKQHYSNTRPCNKQWCCVRQRVNGNLCPCCEHKTTLGKKKPLKIQIKPLIKGKESRGKCYCNSQDWWLVKSGVSMSHPQGNRYYSRGIKGSCSRRDQAHSQVVPWCRQPRGRCPDLQR